jgi:hypothetical protein
MPAKSFGSPNLLDNLIANAHFATALRLVDFASLFAIEIQKSNSSSPRQLLELIGICY